MQKTQEASFFLQNLDTVFGVTLKKNILEDKKKSRFFGHLSQISCGHCGVH